MMPSSRFAVIPAVAAAIGAAAGVFLSSDGLDRFVMRSSADRSRALPTVQAATAAADSGFAVCTVPVDRSNEAFFMLDFRTGDISGAVLNGKTQKFGVSYRHNVLADLGFEPGQGKNVTFLMVTGYADMPRGSVPISQSVLYVTDSATGTTVVYGIPWSPQQASAAQAATVPLVLLDKADPRAIVPAAGPPGRGF
ncbi:MAG: hypothetical protein ACKOCN_00380 [Planctomycetaceae bacterium]